MSTIKKVAIAGAGGHLGPSIVKALLEHGFTVTVLTRPNSMSTFDPAVQVVQTDYAPSSLTSALKGQDAVVCTLGWVAISSQIGIIDAAGETGVQRFIPSDFGYTHDAGLAPEWRERMEAKYAVGEYLQKRAQENPSFSWSAVATGPFIDLELMTSPLFGFDLQSQSATIVDSGNNHFTGTMLPSIGLTVAQILLHPAETQNRWIRILSLKTSQNEILAELGKQTGKAWSVTRLKSEDLKAQAAEFLKAGNKQGYFLSIMKTQLFGDDEVGSSVHCDEGDSDNELLAVEIASVSKLVGRWLAKTN